MFIYSEVSYTVDGTDLFISGDGTVFQDDFRLSGNYKDYVRIIINEGINRIESQAFSSCISLKSVYIPQSVTFIGAPFLWDCTLLNSINISSQNSNFRGDSYGAIYSANFGELYRVPPQVTDFQIHVSTTTLLERCLQGSRQKFIIIPKNVVSMSTYVFGASLLESIEFENGSLIQVIDASSFYNANRLISFQLPASIHTISSSAFGDTLRLVTFSFAEGSQLKTIKNNAFVNSAIESIIFPNQLLTIEPDAFIKCTSLFNISFPASVSSISTLSFSACTSIQFISIDSDNPYYKLSNGILYDSNYTQMIIVSNMITSLIIPSNLLEIGSTTLQSSPFLTNLSVDPNNNAFSAFNGILYNYHKEIAIACVGGIVNATFLPSTKYINDYCCVNCSFISFISFPEGLLEIRQYSFYLCISTANLFIPKAVCRIDTNAFYQSLFASITFESNSNISIIGHSAFYKAIGLSSVVFSNSLKTLSAYSFTQSSIESLSMSNCYQLTLINSYSFQNCNKLQSISFSPSLTTLRDNAFINCISLLTILFPFGNNISTIGNQCFQNCKTLISFEFSNKLQILNSYCFRQCLILQSIFFPENSIIQHIPSTVFVQCTSLTNISIPPSIQSVDPRAFYLCNCLMWIDVSISNTFLSSNNGVLYSKDFLTLIMCPQGKISIIIPPGICYIGDSSFYGSSKLETVTFSSGSNISLIGKNTFYQCTSLLNITMPDSITSIEEYAFQGCISLQTIIFSSGSVLKSIGSRTFIGCESLTSISFSDPCSLELISDNTFENCTSLKYFYCPSSVHTIGSNIFLRCYNLSQIHFGSQSQLTYLSIGMFAHCYSLRDLTMPILIFNISDYCFFDCISLVNLTLPSSLQNIGIESFSGCVHLSINLFPNSIRLISSRAFSYCNSLTSIVIPSAIYWIDIDAFYPCNKLTTVVYCGETVFPSNRVFPSTTKIYVRQSYPTDTIFQLFAYHCLDFSCNIIPATPSPTSLFTFSGDYGNNHLICSCFPLLIMMLSE